MHNNRNNRETVIIPQTIIVPTKSRIVASLSMIQQTVVPLCACPRERNEKKICVSFILVTVLLRDIAVGPCVSV